MKKTYVFRDSFEQTEITITAPNEDMAWEVLCDMYGTGYVFENVEKVS